MSLHKLAKKILFSFRDARGITLLEVIVAMTIGSMLSVGTLGVLNQILILVPKAQTDMLATRQAQNAGYWIERDSICAQAITPTPNLFTVSTGTPLVITYVKWDATKTTISYSVDDNNTLQRQVVVTNEGTGALISSSQVQVADSIESITAQYAQPDVYNYRKILTITVTAHVGNSTHSRVYKISPRPF